MLSSALNQALRSSGVVAEPPTLTKAEIQVVDDSTTIECQFNPSELTITKEAEWSAKGGEEGSSVLPGRNAPELDFGGGKPAEFSLDLFFDTTKDGVDVRLYTNKLLKLTLMRESNGKKIPPPKVRFHWGAILLFKAVITRVEISFLLFHPDGKPLRARAKVNFLQFDLGDDESSPTNPTTRTEPRKTHIIQDGERLDLIAYQEYGHPAHWRFLADANHLLDPKDLHAGQVLIIPPLP
ncbi:MAG TPA: hypothetical protein VIO61_07290 [Anaerolineaceae bacterium]